jgi:hypothetical protein
MYDNGQTEMFAVDPEKQIVAGTTAAVDRAKKVILNNDGIFVHKN